MTTDDQTVAFYDGAARQYFDRFAGTGKPDQDLTAFIAALPKGGRVLDFGCGPGRSAALLRDAGFVVEATDASEGMAHVALEHHGIEVRVEPFEALDAAAQYEGVWANFSLLHAPREAMPGNLERIRRALKPGGVLHIGLKLGDGEARDGLDRLYTFFGKDEIVRLLDNAGFQVISQRTGSGTGMDGSDHDFVIVLASA